MPYRVPLFTLLCVGMIAPGCESRRAPVAPPGPSGGVQAGGSAPSAEIGRALQEIKRRQRCNRVMGCAPAIVLMQHGERAARAITAELERGGDADGYWVPKLIDLLGQLGHSDGLPLLHRLLDDPRWEVRARAAHALGRVGRPESEAILRRHLAAPALEGDVGYHAALWFALSRCAHGERAAAQSAVAALLGDDEARLGGLNPGFFAFGVEMARELRASDALPAVRLAAVHRERSVRLEGIRTLGIMTDAGGIPYVVSRLRDPLPSVRAEALAAMGRITGIREYSTVDEWIAWCGRRDCMASAPRLRPPSAR